MPHPHRLSNNLFASAGALIVMTGFAPAGVPCDIVHTHRIEASSPVNGQQFGRAVALGQDVLLSGSGADNQGCGGTGPLTCGAVWVFERDAAGAWIELGKLFSEDIVSGDQFGQVICLDGNRMAVSATNESFMGAVYVFERSGGRGAGPGGWMQTLKKVDPHNGSGSGAGVFGIATALEGDRLLVGKPKDPGANIFTTGTVFAYDLASPTQSPVELKPSDAVTNHINAFGASVAVCGNTSVVGAPQEGFIPLTNIGQAYVLEGNAEVKKLSPADGEVSDAFGTSVDVDGDTIVVGSPNHRPVAGSRGAVYVYERNNGGANNWGLSQKIEPSTTDVNGNAKFGQRVVIEGDVLAIMSPASSAQKIFLYYRIGGTWQRVAVLVNTFGGVIGHQWQNEDWLAMHQGTIAAGLRVGTVSVNNQGVVMTYDALGDCQSNQIPDACDMLSGGSADANGNRVPDECETPAIPGDVNGDGQVNVTDLLMVISAWGACPTPPTACPADVNGDEQVNVTDLLLVISNWG